MRSTLALTLLAAALVAGGCKKADKKADNAPADPAPKTPEAKPPAPEAKPPAPPAPEPTTDGPTTLQLNNLPVKVGDKKTKIDDIVVVFQIDAKGKKIDAKTVEHKQESDEVLAVEGKIPMKLKVSYTGLSAVQTMGGADKAKPQILDGKSYIVWAEGGAIKATTADDKPVSADELKELTSKNDELGQPDVIEELLEGRTWKIGETYDVTADDLAKIKARTKDADKPQPTAMSFTLQAFDAKEARFGMAMTLVQAMGTDALTFTMKGIARIELATSRGLEMSMEGTLSGAVKGMPTTGTMTAKTLYTY